MNGRRSDGMGIWPILPPLQLRGVGTPFVESYRHYLSRLSAATGVRLQPLVALARNSAPSDVFDSPARSGWFQVPTALEALLFGLERLTGSPDIRCGSFWVLKNVLRNGACGRSTGIRRWCPECYANWNRDSYELMIWDVAILLNCPIHGCALETSCRVCGAKQSQITIYRRRRHCTRCGAALGGAGFRAESTKCQIWVDRQVMDLVELCATPGTRALPASTFETYLSGVVDSAQKQPTRPALLAAIVRLGSRQPTIRTLVNLCALQGVHVTDALLNPSFAGSKPLFASWCRWEGLPLGMGPHESKVVAVCGCLEQILAQCGDGYLPPMDLVLRRGAMNRSVLRELAPELYEKYVAKYEAQGTYTVRLGLQRALIKWIEILESREAHNPNVRVTLKLAKRIAVESNSLSSWTVEIGKVARMMVKLLGDLTDKTGYIRMSQQRNVVWRRQLR